VTNLEGWRRELVLAHLHMPNVIAHEVYRHQRPTPEDAVAAGNLGLVVAAHRFDPMRGVLFYTYAKYWVRLFVMEFKLDNRGPVRFATTTAGRRMVFGLSEARRQVGDRPAAIATYLGLDLEAVEALLPRISGGDVQLDQVNERGHRPPDQAAEQPSPEEAVVLVERRRELRRALFRLGRRDRYIIQELYLRETERQRTSVGQELGITRQRVGALEQRALGILRKALEGVA